MTRPTFGSLFAGVGGFDLGFEAAGWTPRWQVEWDERCRSVLARHWPQVARYGDVRDVRDPEPVDLITYGFPCQDLSVAGRRAGLDGDRSGLFFEATRIIKEMRDASGGRYPTWAVAENVPGLLSADRGAAMGRCLDELAAVGAVDIEWGVVDAQYLGVPQRRRRVFIVARFGAGALGSEPLLPLGEGSAGHPDAGAAQGQGSPGGAKSGAGGGYALSGFARYRDGLATLRASGRDQGGGSEMLVPAWVKARRAQTVDDCETWESDRPAPTLNAFDNGSESRATVLAFAQNQRDEVRDLKGRAGALAASPGMKQQTFVAVPVARRGRNGAAEWEIGKEGVYNALRAGDGGSSLQNAVLGGFGVRRLTPRECERLQGFPDDWTRWDASDNELADSARYRMMGNAVAVPVAKWVASKILKSWACEGSTVEETRTSDLDGTRVQLPTGPLPGAA